jgi:DNA-binding CsgD family transcriptional regulator
MNPIEVAAAALPERVESKEESRPIADLISAWRELDSIPVPKTTWVDKNGLPHHTKILETGEVIYPARDPRGELRGGEDATQVGPDLRPLHIVGTVLWSGAIPDKFRHSELRSEKEELLLNRGYDEASNQLDGVIEEGGVLFDAAGRRRRRDGEGNKSPKDEELTEREWEVIEFLLAGVSDSVIAAKLQVRQVSVRSFVWNIRRKLKVENRDEIVQWAQTSEEEEARSRRDLRREAQSHREEGQRKVA